MIFDLDFYALINSKAFATALNDGQVWGVCVNSDEIHSHMFLILVMAKAMAEGGKTQFYLEHTSQIISTSQSKGLFKT